MIQGFSIGSGRKQVSIDVQNEMIRVMAHQVLREVTASLHTTPFYTIMADETTNITSQTVSKLFSAFAG